MGFYDPEVITGDARRHGIKVLPVDINRSMWKCSVEKGSLRTGFRYVKGIGEEKGALILKAREGGSFSSLQDFIDRTNLDNLSLQNLIAVGAFEALQRSRRQLLWEAETIRMAGGLSGMGASRQEKLPIPEMTVQEETITDYAFQGFSASHHVMELCREKLNRVRAVKSAALAYCRSGAAVLIGGYTVCLQMPPTAKGFTFLTLEDEEGLMNVVVGPDVYHTHRTLIRLEPLLLVKGTLEKKEGLINIKAKSFQALKDIAEESAI